MVIKIGGKSFGYEMAEDNRALKAGSENIFRVKVDNKDFNELSQLLFNNRLKRESGSLLDADKYNIDYEINGDVIGTFEECVVIKINYEDEVDSNSPIIIDFMFDYISYHKTATKTAPKYTTVDIEVPEGKKLIRTEMEFGVLFTYIDDFTIGETVYLYADNNVFKTKIANVLNDDFVEVYIDELNTDVFPFEQISRTLEIIDLTK